jgi:hypothetical protein
MRPRSSWLLVLCGIALLTVPVAPLAAGGRAPLPPIPRLIDQLGSADFAEREAASRALAEAGAPALAALREAGVSPDPEVRRRAADLARQVERRLEAERLLLPRRVRLVFQDTPVPEAVAELARRTGFAIPLQGETDKLRPRRLTFDSGTLPFWEAFDLFCRKAGVAEPELLPETHRRRPAGTPYNGPYGNGMIVRRNVYNPYGTDEQANRLALVDGRAPELPTCVVGAVRVRALPSYVPMPTLLLGTEERLLALEVTAEPDVTWQGVITLQITRAVDEHGRRLTQPVAYVGSPTVSNAQYGFVQVWDTSGYGGYAEPNDPRHIPVRLRVGPSGARMVKELEGVLTAQVQTPSEPLLSVEDVTRAVGKTEPGRHGGWLRIAAASRDANGVVKVQGQISYPPSEEAPPAWMNPAGGRVGQVMFFAGPGGNPDVPNLELRDTRGVLYQRLEQAQGPGPGGDDPRPHDFRLTFQPRPGQTEPAQLIFVGRRTLLVEVPFTLKDVALR